jgi:hypothetical protein
MADKDRATNMKSSYQLSLERLEKLGIERPREETFTEELRVKIIAELEILHKDRLKSMYDPAKREEEEADYVRERRRIEEDRDRKIGELRK